MLISMSLLMAYSLIGELFHEVAGVMTFILFIVHHIYNRKYFLNIFKGSYNAYRAVQLIINIVLLILMFVQPISGILMSKKLFAFIDITNTSLIRSIHLMCAYWLYVFVCIHAGMHMYPLTKKIRKKLKKRYWIFEAMLVLISIYGLRCFIYRDFLDYMFMNNMFVYLDFNEPLFYFFIDYFSIMIMFMYAGYVFRNSII